MPAPDDVAASLVDELAKAGEHVDTGDFTLDPAKAREKLREYQLADAHEWILLAIAAGYLATGGRGPVHVHTGARASVQFPAIDVGSVELERCFAAVFEREKGLEGEALTRARVLRLLGLAANAVLSLRAELELESVDDVIRIEVHGRGEGRRSVRRERELVLERCSLATTAIFLDDTPISQGPTFTMPMQRAEIRLGDTVVGMAAFEQYGVAPAKALVINRGVLVETVMLPDCGSGFVAIVDIDRPTDLAQRQVLRDETWEQLLAAIRAVHDTLPRPRVVAGGSANTDIARPKHRVATAVAMVLGSAVLGLLAVLWLLSDDNPESDPWHDCDEGDLAACTELLERGAVDSYGQVELWRMSCEAGNNDDCMLHAEALRVADPDRALQMMMDVCGDQIDTCEQALFWADLETAARLAHSLCFRTGDPTYCRSWLTFAQATCQNHKQCAALRESLRTACLDSESGEFCEEAGWMAHLGYGGPPSSGKELFEHACRQMTDKRSACVWLNRPPVSEQACADGDAWACYALGHQAYHRIGDVEASIAHFQAACELELAVGCRAAKLAQERNGPLIAFPKFER
jgi:hypothetical protein